LFIVLIALCPLSLPALSVFDIVAIVALFGESMMYALDGMRWMRCGFCAERCGHGSSTYASKISVIRFGDYSSTDIFKNICLELGNIW
jgi:hypothetical protein